MELTVRYAKRDELERVNELRRAVSELHANGRPDIFRPGFGGDLSERVYSAFDEEDTDVIAAVCGGTVCGFALVHRIDKPESPYMCARKIYHIEEFGVDSDFRRRGVGSALIGFCRSEAARTGFGRISLDVWSFNESALKFYESLGFRTSRSYMEADVDLPCRSASRRNRRGAYPYGALRAFIMPSARNVRRAAHTRCALCRRARI